MLTEIMQYALLQYDNFGHTLQFVVPGFVEVEVTPLLSLSILSKEKINTD